MHKHHGTLRLLLQLLAIVIIGVAGYILLVYGLSRHEALPTTATTTLIVTSSTPSASSTSSFPGQMGSATSSPISTVPTTPAWEAGMKVITSNDNNTTVQLALNERFVIQLGSGLNWTLTFSPNGIISRVPNSTTAEDIQGIYEAGAPGTVTMRATGAPICTAHQACPMFLAVSTITFVVK